MTKKGVVFDLDGLLIDSEPIWERVLRDLLAEHGAAYDASVARSHLGMRLDDVVATLRAAYGLDLNPRGFGTRLIDAGLAAFEEDLRLMPGAQAALDLAADRAVAIASSSPLRVIRWVVDRFGWRLDALCSGDEARRGKPAPDIYLLAAERLGLEPRECVAFEDSPHGARAARAAGMTCIGVPTESEGFSADLVLGSLTELEARHLI